MSPSQWGPPTWIFLHVLAEQVKPESWPIIGQPLVSIIKNEICGHLPCPECSQHAKNFWSNVVVANLRSPTDLKNLLYVFHNKVNQRKGYRQFRYNDLQYYGSRGVIESFNAFAKVFNTHGNMNLINESFHRNMALSNIRKFLMSNIQHFNVMGTGSASSGSQTKMVNAPQPSQSTKI